MKHLEQKFQEVFGAPAEKQFFAPGRVNLIGEHTDYNGGNVFPCAIDKGTYGLVKKRNDRKFRMYSENFADLGVMEFTLDELTNDKKHDWANYPKGVIKMFLEAGQKIDSGFDILFSGNIPNGAGLSSSASIEMLTAIVLKDLFHLSIDPVEMAQLGKKTENLFIGVNSGIMDQFAVAMGKKDNAIFLDPADLSYEYAPVKLRDAKVLITNSHVKHSLVDSAYNDRRNESTAALKALKARLDINGLGDLTEEEFEANKELIKDETQRKRARHAVYENQRTIKAVAALKNNDIETFGKLMNASHVSLRDDYEVSCAEVDKLVDISWSIPGVIGSRITGGGFGGCTVSIVKNDAVDNFKREVISKYKAATGIDAEVYEAEIGDGAGRAE